MNRGLPGRVRFALVAFPAFLAQISIAEGEPRTPSHPVNVHALKLERIPELPHGVIAIVEGTVGPEGTRFVVDNLSLLQPVAVTLQTPERDSDLRLTLSKYAVREPAREGSTRGKGWCTFQFRTEGDVQIALASPQGERRYRLAVWAGDEIAQKLAPVVVAMRNASAGSPVSPAAAGGRPAALWAIAAVLFVLAVSVAVGVARRRGGR